MAQILYDQRIRRLPGASVVRQGGVPAMQFGLARSENTYTIAQIFAFVNRFCA